MRSQSFFWALGHPELRYVIEDKCTGCTTCVEYCPVQIPDRYNENLSLTKAVDDLLADLENWGIASFERRSIVLEEDFRTRDGAFTLRGLASDVD